MKLLVPKVILLPVTDVKAATVVGNYNWTFAKVYSGGEYGIGEGFPAPQLEGVIKEFGKVILGEDALNVGRTYDKLRWAAVPSGGAGVNAHALSAIEIAILDLVGKHLNVPVYTLLGGRYRDTVRVYVDTHAGQSLEAMSRVLLPVHAKWMAEMGVKEKTEENAPLHGRAVTQKFSDEYTPESYARRAKEMKDEKYTAIKFDLDVPTPYTKDYTREEGALTNQEIAYLASLIAGVRQAVGEEVDILFDLHWKFNVSTSIRLAKAAEPYGLMWLEDPLPPDNIPLLGEVARSTTVPIASGENQYGRHEFSRLLESGVGIITPDAPKCGGLMETRLISQMASMREVTVSPHNISSPIGTMAQAHLAASIPNFGVLEFHGHDVPIWNRLAKRKLIHDGFIRLTDEPGLGIDLDETVAARYALDEKFEL